MISAMSPTISVTCLAEIARVQRQARNRTRERNRYNRQQARKAQEWKRAHKKERV